jgi:hypothetical protein
LKATGSLADVVSRFVVVLKAKLFGKAAVGAPEDQLRAPLEQMIADLATPADPQGAWGLAAAGERGEALGTDHRRHRQSAEPKQAELLRRICDGPPISRDDLNAASVATPTDRPRRKAARRRRDREGELID